MVFGDSLAHGTALAAPFSVIDAGVPNERAARILRDSSSDLLAGEQRICAALSQARPHTLLIIEGTNDVLEGVYRGDSWIPSTVQALRGIIVEARQAGVHRIIIATVPPQRIGGARHRDEYERVIPALNEAIRRLVLEQRVELFDLYQLIAADEPRFLSTDDVHLTPAGYAEIWRFVRW